MSCQNVAGNLRFRCARATDHWGSMKRVRAGAGVAWRVLQTTVASGWAKPTHTRLRAAVAQRGASSSCGAAAMVGESISGSGHRGPRVTGSRCCNQSSQGATEPRDGLGRPTRDKARARSAARQGNAEHDDTVTTHTRGKQPRTCGARF
jgi:hypothetical protein